VTTSHLVMFWLCFLLCCIECRVV